MSNPAVCPECKKKPVAIGRYLCEPCEASIVAATEAEAGRMNKSFGHKPRRKIAIPWPQWRRVKDLDAQISEVVELAFQRPRWVQYAVMTWLIILGVACIWGAKTIADGSHGRVVAIKDVKDTVTDIAQSWHRLSDAMN